MRTWIKLASLTLVAALAAGARAQDKPRNDDRPRDDTKTRTTEEKTRTTEERTRTTEERARTDDATRGEEKALTDSHFVDHAYTVGQNELLLARLALQRSRNEDVRKFAAKMIEDHGKCGNNLIILVSEQRIAVPDRPLPEQEKDLRRLHEPGLADFDRVYIEHAVKDHEQAVKLFERGSKELKNEKLKAFAEKNLATLKEHQKLAQDTLAKVGGDRTTETGTRTTETRTRETTRDDGSRGLTDNDFVMKASASGTAEVAIGKLGQEKGKSADLKKFADRVVTDHSKVNVELMRAARDAGISVSEKPAEQDEHVKHIRDQSDKDFDKAFAKHMVESHTKGVELFTKASKELKNESLRSLAEKTLPTLKEHLQMAKDVQAKVDRE
jgi:putative membrane protein